MIPKAANEYTIIHTEQPNKTYYFNADTGRITGYITSGLEAVKQAVFLILSTERCQHAIYSWNYGVELADLFGQPAALVYSEIKRRVYEALTQDSRILGVDGFKFEEKRGAVHAAFTVQTNYGDFDYGMDVSY